ncbi:MAG: hypothetical protein VX589_08290 [Myxococcota bacterium]|nr:hypothetical protein [Myxococcota bacterium]
MNRHIQIWIFALIWVACNACGETGAPSETLAPAIDFSSADGSVGSIRVGVPPTAEVAGRPAADMAGGRMGSAGAVAGQLEPGLNSESVDANGGAPLAQGGIDGGGRELDANDVGGRSMPATGPGCPDAGSVCPSACAWVKTCALAGECPSLDATDGPGLEAFCLQRCQTSEAVGMIICGHEQCAQSIDFLKNDVRFAMLCRGEALPEMADPVVPQCSALSDCLNECADREGGQLCIDACYDNSTPEAAQRYGAIIRCVRNNRCVDVFNRIDQACLYDNCGREMDRCFGPRVMATGEGSCFDLLTCLDACPDQQIDPNGGRMCARQCIENTAPPSYDIYQTAIDCVRATQCDNFDATCQNRFCGDEIRECVDDGRPTGPDSCAAVAECFWRCPTLECRDNCYENGTDEAQRQFRRFLICNDEQRCFTRAQCEAACPEETRACGIDNQPPADDVPLGGAVGGMVMGGQAVPGGVFGGRQSGPDGGTPDGGTPDGGATDGGAPDGGTPDGGTPDGGTPDGGTPDGGAPDGGAPGGGMLSGGMPDGVMPGGGMLSGGMPDGGTPGGGMSSGGMSVGGLPGGGPMSGGTQASGGADGGTPDGGGPDDGLLPGDVLSGGDVTGGQQAGGQPDSAGSMGGAGSSSAVPQALAGMVAVPSAGRAGDRPVGAGSSGGAATMAASHGGRAGQAAHSIEAGTDGESEPAGRTAPTGGSD